MSTPIDLGPALSDEDEPSAQIGIQTRSRSRAASAASSRSGAARPPLHERLSKSNWKGKSKTSRPGTSEAHAVAMTPGSEATPWSDLDDEDTPRTVQEPQDVAPTMVPRAVPRMVHDLPHHTQRPIPIRAATFPTFREAQLDPSFMPQIPLTHPHASETGNRMVAPWNIPQLVEAAFASHEHRITSKVNQRLAQYATRDEVASLQEEIERLSVLVDTLGRQRMDRSPHERARREYRPNSASERPQSPVGNVSDDDYVEDRKTLRRRAPRHEYRPRDRNNTSYGLRELEPSDPRFSEILSYRRYRLSNQDDHFGPEVSRNIGVWVRRLEHVMGKYTFNGSKPVACLRFLSVFKRQLDNEGIPEAGALRIWPNFLSGEALSCSTGNPKKVTLTLRPERTGRLRRACSSISASHTALAIRSKPSRAKVLLVEDHDEPHARKLRTTLRPKTETVALMEQVVEQMPPSRTATPTVEYSSEEAASISLHIAASTNARGKARRAPFFRRSSAEIEQKATSFESVCFECFLPGHRRPQCPHLSRTTNDPAFKAWVLANFAALQPWQQAWLHSLGRAPESMKSPLPAVPPQMARRPPPPVSSSPAVAETAPRTRRYSNVRLRKTDRGPAPPSHRLKTMVPSLHRQ
eukprot:IDg4418t1